MLTREQTKKVFEEEFPSFVGNEQAWIHFKMFYEKGWKDAEEGIRNPFPTPEEDLENQRWVEQLEKRDWEENNVKNIQDFI